MRNLQNFRPPVAGPGFEEWALSNMISAVWQATPENGAGTMSAGGSITSYHPVITGGAGLESQIVGWLVLEGSSIVGSEYFSDLFMNMGDDPIDLRSVTDPVKTVIGFINSVLDGYSSGTIPDNFLLAKPINGKLNDQGTGLSFAGKYEGYNVSVLMHFSPTSNLTKVILPRTSVQNNTKIYELRLMGTREWYAGQTRKPSLITLSSQSMKVMNILAKLFSR